MRPGQAARERKEGAVPAFSSSGLAASGADRTAAVQSRNGRLAALEREAAHLTRRDRKRRVVTESPDGPGIVEAGTG